MLAHLLVYARDVGASRARLSPSTKRPNAPSASHAAAEDRLWRSKHTVPIPALEMRPSSSPPAPFVAPLVAFELQALLAIGRSPALEADSDHADGDHDRFLMQSGREKPKHNDSQTQQLPAPLAKSSVQHETNSTPGQFG
jgi:hypothetical protein